ncbi:hypothetical protein ACFYKT_14765 [Cytobacillus sp. FJAT-53684]|uniref:ABC transporter permease n=1 Tax=Cytobacillus mangrovibacter TaxID=3299024 RepID=A0ABW6K0C9_9BACI
MNIQSVLKMYSQDKLTWFLIPNIILFSVFLFTLLVSILISAGEQIYTGGASYIFFYMLIIGITVVKQTFPYAIGMSIRRTDYFLGTVAMSVATNILFGILLVILSFIENATNGWGGRVHFFHFPYLNDGTLFEQLMIYIIVLIHLFFLGFLISSFTRRFGGKGLLIAAISLLLIISAALLLVNYYGAWINIFNWFATHTAIQIAYTLILPTLLFIGLSYLMLRKATV